ncbi:MAG: hypothetical protein OEX12_01250 [Gammaproteobacteria bacterium]|nr:hypothetical protein [Gammaproteobacteria bacterium]
MAEGQNVAPLNKYTLFKIADKPLDQEDVNVLRVFIWEETAKGVLQQYHTEGKRNLRIFPQEREGVFTPQQAVTVKGTDVGQKFAEGDDGGHRTIYRKVTNLKRVRNNVVGYVKYDGGVLEVSSAGPNEPWLVQKIVSPLKEA